MKTGNMLQAAVHHNSTVYRLPGRSYATFHDVLLRKNGLLFFLPDEMADGSIDEAHTLPDMQETLAWQFWDDIDFHVRFFPCAYGRSMTQSMSLLLAV